MMKTYIVVVCLIYGLYYLGSKNVHGPQDALVYAQKHPDPKWSPRIDYWVGMYYYHRGDFPKAQEAFTQLLTDYPTGQYAADGLQLLGFAAEENHDWAPAKGALYRYIQEYPDGKERAVVDKKLELIKYHHPGDFGPFPPPKE